jgi:hypothetical protein
MSPRREASLKRAYGVLLALVAPGLLPLLRRRVTVARCVTFLASFAGIVSLLLWLFLCPAQIRTFEPIAMWTTQGIEAAFLGKLAEAQQAGDAIVLVAEVGRGSIRFQRLEPIVGPGDPIQPQPYFLQMLTLFCALYAWGVLSSLRELFERPEVSP